MKDYPAQTNINNYRVSVVVCAYYRILNILLPSSLDFTLWRRVLYSVLADSLPAAQQPLPTSNALIHTASSPVKRENDPASLRAHFDLNKAILTQARRKHLLATNIINTVDALLAQNERCLNQSVVQLDKHQKALEDHLSLLKTFRSLDTQHETVGQLVKASISIERRGVRRLKQRVECFKRSRQGWKAGLKVCRDEQELQAEKACLAKAANGCEDV